jgi:hypothetical protein
MNPTHHRLSKTGRWLVAIGCALSLSLARADMPSGEELLGRIGVPPAKVAELDLGKTISWEPPENSDKELADAVAVYVQVPLAKVVAFVKKGDFAGLDATVTAQASLPERAGAEAFKRFALPEDEAQDLLDATAGDKFNLSQEEFARFAELKAGGADAQAAAQRYREILAERYQAYRQKGLAGIAPYARDGGRADPAEELRVAAGRGIALVQNYFPELYDAWLNYPKPLPDGATERFTWQSRKVEDRPTATLTHRLTQATDGGALVLQRQYYVGHSYNSSQLALGCLPYRDGALVFYSLRSSTDQVAGMGSGLKHSIGRDRMKAEMVKQLQGLGKRLK